MADAADPLPDRQRRPAALAALVLAAIALAALVWHEHGHHAGGAAHRTAAGAPVWRLGLTRDHLVAVDCGSSACVVRFTQKGAHASERQAVATLGPDIVGLVAPGSGLAAAAGPRWRVEISNHGGALVAVCGNAAIHRIAGAAPLAVLRRYCSIAWHPR